MPDVPAQPETSAAAGVSAAVTVPQWPSGRPLTVRHPTGPANSYEPGPDREEEP